MTDKPVTKKKVLTGEERQQLVKLGWGPVQIEEFEIGQLVNRLGESWQLPIAELIRLYPEEDRALLQKAAQRAKEQRAQG